MTLIYISNICCLSRHETNRPLAATAGFITVKHQMKTLNSKTRKCFVNFVNKGDDHGYDGYTHDSRRPRVHYTAAGASDGGDQCRFRGGVGVRVGVRVRVRAGSKLVGVWGTVRVRVMAGEPKPKPQTLTLTLSKTHQRRYWPS